MLLNVFSVNARAFSILEQTLRSHNDSVELSQTRCLLILRPSPPISAHPQELRAPTPYLVISALNLVSPALSAALRRCLPLARFLFHPSSLPNHTFPWRSTRLQLLHVWLPTAQLCLTWPPYLACHHLHHIFLTLRLSLPPPLIPPLLRRPFSLL